MTPGVELVAGALGEDDEADDASGLGPRVADDDTDVGDDGLLTDDEFAFCGRESVGGDRSQSALPLEATFAEYWQ